MMVTITERVLGHALDHAVAEDGADHRAPLCPRYRQDDGSPSCLVGVILAHAGFPLDTLTEKQNRTRITRLAVNLGLDIRPEALARLEEIQEQSDDGFTWGQIRDGQEG